MTARAAAAALMIFGGVAIVALSVGSAAYAIANPSWLDAQLAAVDPAVREQIDAVLTREVVTSVVVACGLAGLMEGGLSILLGAFVGRGKRWAIATSIGVTFFRLALVALCLVATAISSVDVQRATGADASSATSAAITFGGLSRENRLTLVPLAVAAALLLATLVLLFRSRRATPPQLPVARASGT